MASIDSRSVVAIWSSTDGHSCASASPPIALGPTATGATPLGVLAPAGVLASDVAAACATVAAPHQRHCIPIPPALHPSASLSESPQAKSSAQVSPSPGPHSDGQYSGSDIVSATSIVELPRQAGKAPKPQNRQSSPLPPALHPMPLCGSSHG